MEIERNAKTRFSWSDVFEADVSFIVRLISIIIAVAIKEMKIDKERIIKMF